ncbi:hypothetical protein ACFXJ8_25285 [Nonomuraea sp. NPDC059194]|uniref:hypothetical protein n=1 Tax=Nonomuraea sp. NPDC059194 TaxID=3346764 RepID=UPI0036C255AE
MSTAENHAETGNGRRLTAAAVLALVLASGAMAATTSAADAAVAKPNPGESSLSGRNHNETVLARN